MERIDSAEPKRLLRARGFSSYYSNEFCRLLAEALSDTVDPLGFLLEFSILSSAIDKSRKRSVEIRGKEVETFITGNQLGVVFDLELPSIVRKVFPKEFADTVLAERVAIYSDAQHYRTRKERT